jgi:hypothetical protein
MNEGRGQEKESGREGDRNGVVKETGTGEVKGKLPTRTPRFTRARPPFRAVPSLFYMGLG